MRYGIHIVIGFITINEHQGKLGTRIA